MTINVIMEWLASFRIYVDHQFRSGKQTASSYLDSHATEGGHPVKPSIHSLVSSHLLTPLHRTTVKQIIHTMPHSRRSSKWPANRGSQNPSHQANSTASSQEEPPSDQQSYSYHSTEATATSARFVNYLGSYTTIVQPEYTLQIGYTGCTSPVVG